MVAFDPAALDLGRKALIPVESVAQQYLTALDSDTECLLLVQMVGLYKDPSGENIFSKASTMSPTLGLTTQSSEVDSLKKKIVRLEKELKEKVMIDPYKSHDNHPLRNW